MNSAMRFVVLLATLLLVLAVPTQKSSAAPLSEETMSFRPFGTIHVYRGSARPDHVVIFISGDGGWNLGVIDMARELARLDSLVVGIDITTYLKHLAAESAACTYSAATFEELSQVLEKHYGYPDYVTPLLVGYSSGATLVYATLAQAPPNTFRGGISLGFCPDLPLQHPLCHGSGLLYERKQNNKGFTFLPVPNLQTPWITLQGDLDRVCNADVAARFVTQTGNARLVRLPKVGHGFSVPRNWLPQLLENFNQLVTDVQKPAPARLSALRELPLVEVTVKKPGKTFAIIVSGDGGWASIDKSLADALAADGIPTVGLDSLHYFWKKRTPEEAGKALQDIVQYYLANWKMEKIILIGYSRGGDVLPFMASRLPPESVSHISLITLLGAAHSVDFEFHMTDWLPGEAKRAPYKILPEVEKLAGRKLLCIYGEDESAPLCPDLESSSFKSIKMPGGHHFGGDYKRLAKLILRESR